MVFGPLAMIVALAIAGLAIGYVRRAFGVGFGNASLQPSPLDILKQRFARGEIDRGQFEDGKRLLSAR